MLQTGENCELDLNNMSKKKRQNDQKRIWLSVTQEEDVYLD